MPKWIISEALKNRKIKNVLIIGVAYKKDLDDTRESPSIDFIKILQKKKIKVDFHDPNVKFLKSRKLSNKYFSKNLILKWSVNMIVLLLLQSFKY